MPDRFWERSLKQNWIHFWFSPLSSYSLIKFVSSHKYAREKILLLKYSYLSSVLPVSHPFQSFEFACACIYCSALAFSPIKMWNAARRDFRSKHRPIQSSGVRAHLASTPSLSVLSLQTIGCNSQHLKIPPFACVDYYRFNDHRKSILPIDERFFSPQFRRRFVRVLKILLWGGGDSALKLAPRDDFFTGNKVLFVFFQIAKMELFYCTKLRLSARERGNTQSRGNHTQCLT